MVRTAIYGGMLAIWWFAGFFVAWAEKWAYAAIVLGPDAMQAELTAIFNKYDTTRERLTVESSARRGAILSRAGTGGSSATSSLRLRRLPMVAMLSASGAKWLRTSLRSRWRTPLAVLWSGLNSRDPQRRHSGFVSRSFILFSVIPLLAALKLWRTPAPRQRGLKHRQ
jgi:hypothetical protein